MLLDSGTRTIFWENFPQKTYDIPLLRKAKSAPLEKIRDPVFLIMTFGNFFGDEQLALVLSQVHS